jgi:hypothetical protein
MPTPEVPDTVGRDETMFVDLFEGRLASLKIGVQVGATQASHRISDDGVYDLTAAEFIEICRAIALEETLRPDRPYTEPLEIARRCDEQGLGDRWFRLSDAVATWISSKRPVMKVESFIE